MFLAITSWQSLQSPSCKLFPFSAKSIDSLHCLLYLPIFFWFKVKHSSNCLAIKRSFHSLDMSILIQSLVLHYFNHVNIFTYSPFCYMLLKLKLCLMVSYNMWTSSAFPLHAFLRHLCCILLNRGLIHNFQSCVKCLYKNLKQEIKTNDVV